MEEDHPEQGKENSGEAMVQDEPAAAGSEAPPNGRILVKLKLPKMSEEAGAGAVEEVEAGPSEEIKTHHCQECDKSFSSGKALGGHMSSAHVQANRDHSLKKLKSKTTSQHKASRSETDIVCKLCDRTFPSRKSLFGHMRSHPTRGYRGMNSPPKPEVDSTDASPGPRFEDVRINQEEEYDHEDENHHDGIDSGPEEAVSAAADGPLKGWSMTGKRGRGQTTTKPEADGPSASSPDDEVVSAVHQLMRLFKSHWKEQNVEQVNERSADKLGRRSDDGSQFKKQKRDHYSAAGKLQICEKAAAMVDEASSRYARQMETNGRGKEKIEYKEKVKPLLFQTGKTSISLSSLPDDSTDSDDHHLHLITTADSVNGTRVERANTCKDYTNKVSPNQQRGDNGTSTTTPEKYTCNTCYKSFPTHQALGGHRSSHKKFKLSIFNTMDNERRQGALSKEEPNGANTSRVNTASDQSGSPADDRHDNSHTCKICNKTFPTGQALGGHKRIHSAGEESNSRAAQKALDIDLNRMPADEDQNDEDHGDGAQSKQD